MELLAHKMIFKEIYIYKVFPSIRKQKINWSISQLLGSLYDRLMKRAQRFAFTF